MFSFAFIGLLSIAPMQDSWGKDNNSLSYFTMQFYRLTLHEAITLHDITLKQHFYVVSGTTSDKEALYYLSRNLLQSKFLKPFHITDTLIKMNGDSFKLFLKTKNVPPKSSQLYVSVEIPNTIEKLRKQMILTGSCYPNGRRVSVFGSVNKMTMCKNKKWTIELDLFKSATMYIFAQISDTHGAVFLDGQSVIE